MKDKIFTIIIPTKNRQKDLEFTLKKMNVLLVNENVHCIICDDGSTDGTFEFIKNNYPNIDIIRNEKTKGIHYTRNILLDRVNTPYVLCVDDDVHFITLDILNIIEDYFNENKRCAVIGFRIFWSLLNPDSIISDESKQKVKSFGAGACAFRMLAIREIPKFPEWFVFYGEEDFASIHLIKRKWEIHYNPSILVHHRVDNKARKAHSDYTTRLRRSLRSGWYLYFLFFPLSKISRRFLYTLSIQMKNKVFKGDLRAVIAISLAIFDLIVNMPRLIKYSNRLTSKEFENYINLPNAKLYWKPKKPNIE
ncbi:glycosyltransferase family 2 protein [Flavobacterium soli]|uniref:glycosyltransferase family 2 protein n=1 Tax=Flavobacterium soli TaxID=344881 RepID=UPI00047A09F0|nr:glycosyltransferase [Flavobacterium soli]